MFTSLIMNDVTSQVCDSFTAFLVLYLLSRDKRPVIKRAKEKKIAPMFIGFARLVKPVKFF